VYAEIEEKPKKLGRAGNLPPCGGGTADPQKIQPFPMCYDAKIGCSRLNGMSVKMCLKNLTSRVSPFVTQGHQNRHGSIHHLGLLINTP